MSSSGDSKPAAAAVAAPVKPDAKDQKQKKRDLQMFYIVTVDKDGTRKSTPKNVRGNTLGDVINVAKIDAAEKLHVEVAGPCNSEFPDCFYEAQFFWESITDKVRKYELDRMFPDSSDVYDVVPVYAVTVGKLVKPDKQNVPPEFPWDGKVRELRCRYRDVGKCPHCGKE